MTGPFSRKQIQQKREDYILQVTEEILTEKGYYDMSMDEIASRVGISKVTLYRHFKSKEDLIFSLLFRDMPTFFQELDQKIPTNLPVIEKIESIIYLSMLKFLQRDSALSLSFISSLGELPIFLKSKQEELEKVDNALADYLLPLLKDGQSEGSIDSSIPPELLLGTFSGIISSLGLRDANNNISEKELAEIGTRLYMKAIIV
ncbi:TetR/AcrR family transcriptional regulator [Aquibacillus sediminis]|uniref:TetR/AcrR family transcriptional regulator n=1 Tax=Aquibacillus sediminis TaxID=2574734 RepID=UPI001109A6D8|nr:TetR/AcrR family transcriptional regulator [Aquibacillus sediminis]